MARARGCADGYDGDDFGTGRDFELSQSAVKCDAVRACQAGPQNLDLRPDLAGVRLRLHKRTQA